MDYPGDGFGDYTSLSAGLVSSWTNTQAYTQNHTHTHTQTHTDVANSYTDVTTALA